MHLVLVAVAPPQSEFSFIKIQIGGNSYGLQQSQRRTQMIDHNNKFSDMFESKVIDALGFIKNELDIKSSKGIKYASYDAVITIEGADYDLSLHGDNEIFNGRVLKSANKSQMISSYEKAVKIAGDESKVQ